jgi:hypothetical protein
LTITEEIKEGKDYEYINTKRRTRKMDSPSVFLFSLSSFVVVRISKNRVEKTR